MKKLIVLTSLILTAGISAQAQTGTPVPGMSPGVSAQAANATKVTYTDAQIVGIMKTANEGEIAAAKLAIKKAQRDDVKAFAKEMLNAHEGNQKDLMKLAKANSLKAEETDKCKMMKKDGKESEKKLKDSKKADFDQEYVLGQASAHNEVLTALDTDLIPNAQNAALKSYLTDTRTAVNHHLMMVKDLQTAVTSHK